MVITKKDFCAKVEEDYANTDKSIIETVLNTCTQYNIDPELIEPLINRSLKEKIECEFINLNYMKAESIIIV